MRLMYRLQKSGFHHKTLKSDAAECDRTRSMTPVSDGDESGKSVASGWKTFDSSARHKNADELAEIEHIRKVLQSGGVPEGGDGPSLARALRIKPPSGTPDREPVWKKRFRSARASVEPEAHPFDEGMPSRDRRDTRVTKKSVPPPSSIKNNSSQHQVLQQPPIITVVDPAPLYSTRLRGDSPSEGMDLEEEEKVEVATADMVDEVPEESKKMAAKKRAKAKKKNGYDEPMEDGPEMMFRLQSQVLMDVFAQATGRVKNTVTDMFERSFSSHDDLEAYTLDEEDTLFGAGSTLASGTSSFCETEEMSLSTNGSSLYRYSSETRRRHRGRDDAAGCTKEPVFTADEVIDALGICKASVVDVLSSQVNCAYKPVKKRRGKTRR